MLLLFVVVQIVFEAGRHWTSEMALATIIEIRMFDGYIFKVKRVNTQKARSYIVLIRGGVTKIK